MTTCPYTYTESSVVFDSYFYCISVCVMYRHTIVGYLEAVI